MDFTTDEKLVIGSTFLDALKGEIDALKADKKDVLMCAYQDMGVDSIRLEIGGEKVGKAYVTGGKPKLTITDDALGLDYLERLGMVDRKPCRGWEHYFAQLDDGSIVCTLTGEVVPWVEMRDTAVNTAIRIDKPEKVIPIINRTFGAVPLSALLPEGGTNA